MTAYRQLVVFALVQSLPLQNIASGNVEDICKKTREEDSISPESIRLARVLKGVHSPSARCTSVGVWWQAMHVWPKTEKRMNLQGEVSLSAP